MTRVPDKPRRRTYRTGENLPELTTEWRPIPLGRDENGDNDGQIRALAVLLRNRSNSPVYIREGPEADDAFEISAGEDYRIWEPNGVNSVRLKGENGGETVEVRTLEAHNNFDITDRIEAFARSIAHFVGTATTTTTIDGQNIDLSIDDADGISIVGDVDASGSTVDASGSTVTVDDISSTSATFDVSGSVNVDSLGDTVTVDDISAASASFDGDITGQTDFDLSVRDIEGTPEKRFIQESGQSATYNSTDGSYYKNTYVWDLKQNADYDGFITGIWVRYYTYDIGSADYLDEMGVQVLIDENGDMVSPADKKVLPREVRATRNIDEWGRNGSYADIQRYDEQNECVFVIEPNHPIKYQEGQSVGLAFRAEDVWNGASETGMTFEVECSVQLMERRNS